MALPSYKKLLADRLTKNLQAQSLRYPIALMCPDSP
jgi:hypothetical protein